jgi:hypothetical protein
MIRLGAQAREFRLLAFVQRARRVFPQEPLVPPPSLGVYRTARDCPQIVVAEIQQCAQLGTFVRGNIVQHRGQIAADRLQKHRIERLARDRRCALQPPIEHTGQFHFHRLQSHYSSPLRALYNPSASFKIAIRISRLAARRITHHVSASRGVE